MQNSTPAPKKSNLWLIIIIVIVLIILLWPVFRRNKTSTDLTSDALNEEEMASTSEMIDLGDAPADSAVVVSPNEISISPEVMSPVSTIVDASSPAPAVARPPARISLKVFFGNQTRNPQVWQCGTVYPVTRTVANTKAVARAAIGELLSGLRPVNSRAGFFTSINPGVVIKELTIDKGVARVDFDRELITGVDAETTSCLKEAARAEIIETLKQFSTIRQVVISVNGVTF